MSTTFAIDQASAAQGDTPTAEEDSIVYSRYSTMALQSHRPPTLRRSRRSLHPPGSHRAPVHGIAGDDIHTADRCREALRWITTLPEGSIRLEVAAGRVTLHGLVRRNTEREAAGEAVRQVEGVTVIDNQIDVQ